MRQTNEAKALSFNHDVVRTARQAAHDIRSPLSALNLVIGTLESLCEEKRDILKEAISRINKIAEELLALKAEERRADFWVHNGAEKFIPKAKMTSLNFTQFLSDAVRFKQIEQTGSQVQFLTTFTCSKKASAVADKDVLERVLSNVFNNCIESGSKVISVSLTEMDDSLVVSISDDGVGIPSKILEQLVNGAPLTYGKGGKGNGLGLSHARSAVQSMKGDFSLTSLRGSGTCITIRLPK